MTMRNTWEKFVHYRLRFRACVDRGLFSPQSPLSHATLVLYDFNQDAILAISSHRVARSSVGLPFPCPTRALQHMPPLNAPFAPGLKACVVSVSGGVDSAVTLALCKHAQSMPNSPIVKVRFTLWDAYLERLSFSLNVCASMCVRTMCTPSLLPLLTSSHVPFSL